MGATAIYDRPEVVARYVDAARDGLWPREERAVAEFFPPDGRVLDLGCGAGRTTAPLADMGYDVVAVDVSGGMLDRARCTADAAFVRGDASRLAFADDSFDAVLFSHNGLDELPTRQGRQDALCEIRRVLRPGGRFAFSTHNLLRQFVPYPPTRAALAQLAAFWRRNAGGGTLRGHWKYDVTAFDGTHAVYYADPLTQYRELAAAGFDVLAFLGKRGPATRYLGNALFVVATPRRRLPAGAE